MNQLICLIAAIYGLIIGSFLSVCIYRIPYGRTKGLDSLEEDDDEEFWEKSELSIFKPARSFCPECKTTLKWYNNLPLFSYIIQKGKCSNCKTKIPFRYPLIEILSAGLAYLSFYQFDWKTALLVYIFSCLLIIVSFIDLDYFIIPNNISIPTIGLGILLAIITEFYPIFAAPVTNGILTSLYGLMAGAGFLWLISFLYLKIKGKLGLGFGDVKLLAMVGLFFGANVALSTIFIGSLLGSVIGLLFIVFSGSNMTRPIPFGPFLSIGAIISIYFVPNIFVFFIGSQQLMY